MFANHLEFALWTWRKSATFNNFILNKIFVSIPICFVRLKSNLGSLKRRKPGLSCVLNPLPFPSPANDNFNCVGYTKKIEGKAI